MQALPLLNAVLFLVWISPESPVQTSFFRDATHTTTSPTPTTERLIHALERCQHFCISEWSVCLTSADGGHVFWTITVVSNGWGWTPWSRNVRTYYTRCSLIPQVQIEIEKIDKLKRESEGREVDLLRHPLSLFSVQTKVKLLALPSSCWASHPAGSSAHIE